MKTRGNVCKALSMVPCMVNRVLIKHLVTFFSASLASFPLPLEPIQSFLPGIPIWPCLPQRYPLFLPSLTSSYFHCIQYRDSQLLGSPAGLQKLQMSDSYHQYF